MTLADDNILQALLNHSLEEECLKYMGYYSRYLNKELFLYALSHNNDVFMQKALLMGAFSEHELFERENREVINEMLAHFEDGAKTNFILNIFHLLGFDLWKNDEIASLLDSFENFSEDNYLENRLILSYNPLMSIALTAEILMHISKTRKRYRDKCNDMMQTLLELGKMYAGKIADEDLYQRMLTDTDFSGRSVLFIICECGFQPLMCEEDPKAENLIQHVWHGSESTKCDGSIFGFSNLTHIIFSKGIKQTDEKMGFFDIVTMKFKVNKSVDYTFQHKYRSKAISNFFLKEFLFASVMTYFLISMANKYTAFFQGDKSYLPVDQTDPDNEFITPDPNESIYDFGSYPSNITNPLTDVRTNPFLVPSLDIRKIEFDKWEKYTIITNCSALYFLFCKIVFNICKKKEKTLSIRFDIWTQIDVCSALFSITTFRMISQSSIDQLDPSTDWKRMLNYMVTANAIFQYLRAFSFLLLIESLSKMIITFLNMLIDTLPFLMLLCIFILLMMSICATLFQDVNPDMFGYFTISFQSVFDGILAPGAYTGFGEFETLWSVIYQLITLFGNVLMLNYLVAILSSTYENLLQYGSFLYKVKKFQYCQRY